MQNSKELKEKIDKAKVVSFDMFDTLVFRIVDRPTAVFEIMEKDYHIHNFSELRQKYQNEASLNVMQKQGYPHADFDEIYDWIKKNLVCNLKIEELAEKEIALEKSLIYANPEMKKIYEYAKAKKKRVIVSTDMYLKTNTIQEILKQCGYTSFDAIYDSADIKKAKFDKSLFKYVLEQEKVEKEQILHIGDNEKDDIKNAQEIGLETFWYIPPKFPYEKSKTNEWLLSLQNGLLRKMYLEKKLNPEDFWINLGFNVGGPIYQKMYNYLKKEVESHKDYQVFFLARDGYNLLKLNEKKKDFKAQYLYTSRRALLLAGIDKIDKQALENLPPFTLGQTVQEILDYLDFNNVSIKIIQKAGFEDFSSRITSLEDIEKFKKIYGLCEKEFLKHCEQEKKNALNYFKSIGLLKQNALIFDCGWHGSSQYLLEKFLENNGYQHQIKFVYVGIEKSKKSEKQLEDRMYSTCFFDQENSYKIDKILESIVLFELFFGAPEGSVWHYNKTGYELEKIEKDFSYKKELLNGILLYDKVMQKFYQEYLNQIDALEFLKPLERLITKPTKKEATIIGNIQNVDGFVHQKDETKYIAYLTKKALKNNPNIEIYWKEGLLKRDDISKYVKSHINNNGSSVKRKAKNVFKKTPIYRLLAKVKYIMYTEGLRAFAFRKKQGFYNRIVNHGSDYIKWIRHNEPKKYKKAEHFEYNPKISLVVPVYNVISSQLEECIHSVLNQTYSNFELIMIDDHSSMPTVKETLKKYENEKQIKIGYHEKNEQISKTTNDCIQMATGEFIGFLDCDDVLAPNALEEVVRELNKNKELDFIYSDEDKLTEDGKKRHDPFFKPDWSPDTFLSLMYTCHFSVYRKKIVDEIGGLTVGLDGAQDYDFTLRFVSKTNKIAHISKILYHWRERPESIASDPEAKPYALEAIKNLKERYLKENNLKGKVEFESSVYQYRIVYEDSKHSKVSIIILSKDHPEVLKTCISSIRQKTKYENYEIIVIDNGSNKTNKEKYEKLSKEYQFLYHYEKLDFNFSKMCNTGAKLAKGDYYLFLNDDTEVLQSEWLERMLGQASQKHTGAVGAKLYYPNSLIIQHDGILNLRHGPSHVLMNHDDSKLYYYCNNRMDYNYIAVTGACLMINKEKFDEVNGFDEKLPVAYNDVDLCFKLYEKGYYNVVRNDVKLYHYESLSRGIDTMNREKIDRLRQEKTYLYLKHSDFVGHDPFYNSNLDQTTIDFKIDIKKNKYCEITKTTEEFKINEQNTISAIDKLGFANQFLKIYGYAFIDGFSHNNSNQIFIILVNNKEQYKIKAQKMYRPDLSGVYNIHCNLSAFSICVNKNNIKKGKYKIYIQIKNKKYNLQKLIDTKFKIDIY